MARPLWKPIGVILAIAALAVAAVAVCSSGSGELCSFFLSRDTHPALFIGLMFVLPALGFPVSLFFILAGLKFGFWLGMGLTALCVPAHLGASYLLGKRLLRRPLERLLSRYQKKLPVIPRSRMVPFTVLFIGVPGLPYAVKNYFMVLAGVPISLALGLAYPMHLLVAAAFVAMGRSAAHSNFWLAGGLLALVALGFAGIRLLYNRMRNQGRRGSS